MQRKRILYYCQSLVGIGHLSASLRIVRALLQHSDIDFIQGGLGEVATIDDTGFRSARLPTLLHDSESGEFYDPDEQGGVERVWRMRATRIREFLRWPYHAIVVEFYPFGRRRFKDEIHNIFKAVRDHCGAVPVFTSVREVLVPRPLEKERRMVASVKKYIHTVFVRGDPNIVRLDETFSLAHEIEDQLCYTGYLAAPRADVNVARKQQILVSIGGGNVGQELLDATIAVATSLPQFAFVLAAGSRASDAQLAALRLKVASDNVQIVPFLSDFQRHLRESCLSINMGGDNTLVDVVTARTPSLAYPYSHNPEQEIRIRKFAQRGFVHALTAEDLSAARLKGKIEQALRASYPEANIAVDGAAVTSAAIHAVLEGISKAPCTSRELG